jgi:hypothetical protein
LFCPGEEAVDKTYFPIFEMDKKKTETRNVKLETFTCQVYPCPHCRAQNFATRVRLRQAGRIPLTCWKCGEELERLRPIPAKHKAKIIKSKKK